MNKRFFVVAAIIATLALTFVGCGIREDDLVGTWKGSSGVFQGLTFEFNSAGGGQYWFTPNAKADFTWSVSKKTLSMQLGGTYGSLDVELKISGSTMEWVLSGQTYAKFEKQ